MLKALNMGAGYSSFPVIAVPEKGPVIQVDKSEIAQQGSTQQNNPPEFEQGTVAVKKV